MASHRASATAQVLCIGDVMIDVLAALSAPFAVGSDSPGTISVLPGGSGANTAAWLSALGRPVQFVGRVGRDAFGEQAEAALRAQGVGTRLTRDDRFSTGTCVVLVTPDGERSMIPSAGANAALSAEDVNLDALSAGDHLHLSAYTLLRPETRAVGLDALHTALRKGASVSVDASSAEPLRQVGGETFLSWLPRATLLLANLAEAQVLSERSDPESAATSLQTRGIARVVVKAGGAGAVVADRLGCVAVPADKVALTDSTGAGDAFAAGLLDSLLSGASLAAAASCGNAVAARAVTLPGGRPPLPEQGV